MSSVSSENKNMRSHAQPKRYRDANWVPGANNKHTKYKKVDMYDMEYKSSGATTADEELKQEELDSDYKGDESESGSESESEDEGDESGSESEDEGDESEEDEGDESGSESESESEGNGITDQDDPNFEWGNEGEEWEWVDESIDDE